MYNDNILTHNDQSQKSILKQSYSNNCLYYQNVSSLSKHYHSTHSLPILHQENTSFAQFIAEEKYNLQFFPSFKKTKKILDNGKDKKKLIKNFHLRPCNISNNHRSTLNNSKVFDDEKTATCITHSSNFALSTLSDISNTKKTKSITGIFAHNAMGIINMNRKRRMRCIERHISYMNSDQTKAALCFILQLNTYINQKILPLQKESNEINEYYVKLKKVDDSLEKIIALDTNTTSTLDFTSKSNLNDTHLVETNDSIDISMQLSNNPDSSSELISNKNYDLLAFYNRPIMNNIFDKTINSIGSHDLLFDDETNVYNIVHLSSEKEGKAENQQALAKSKTDHDALNHAKMQKTTTKYEKFGSNTSFKFNDEMTTNIPAPQIAHVTNILTVPLQRIQTPMKSIERIEMKNPTSNRTEINIHQQSTILNSSLTDHNYNFSKSLIDLQNLLNESNEKKSSLPLYSRCLASFEFANREEHLVEIIELPRSLHRVSRMDTYKKIRQRLALVNLIDINLTALLRTVLQTFS